MRERLQNYALFSEIISAFAVVISLLYVGYQIQINTAERRTESIQAINTGYRELALVYVEIEEAGIAWHKMIDEEVLSKRQVDIMSDSLFAHLMLLEDTYNQHKEGYVNDEFLASKTSLETFRISVSPQIQNVYENMKQQNVFTASFTNWLDEELERSR